MSTDFRALCAELLAWADVTAAHYIQLPAVMLRARAELAKPADGPAVPEGRGPAAVAEQPRPDPPAEGEVAELVAWLREEAAEQSPDDSYTFPSGVRDCLAAAAARLTRAAELLERAAPVPVPVAERLTGLSDEELRDLWSWAAGQDQGPWPTQQHAFAHALAVALWGQPPAPPAEGEVAELVEFLRTYGDYVMDEYGDVGEHEQLTRAAELLERAAPVPVSVPVSERPWEREGWCDEQGRCWFGRDESGNWSADWTLTTTEAVEDFCTYALQTMCLPAHALPLPAPQGEEVE